MTTFSDTATPPTTISLAGPAGLVRSIPVLLGFVPRDSLVVLSLQGRRVGPVMRVDLPPGCIPDPTRRGGPAAREAALAAAGRLADHLAAQAVRHAEQVVLIVYADRSPVPGVQQCLVDVMTDAGLQVLDLMRVHGTVLSFLTGCDGITRPDIDLGAEQDPGALALEQEMALRGRAVLPDRAALAASIAAPAGPALHRARAAVQAARERAGRSPVRSAFPALDAAVWQVGARGTVDQDTAADLALCLQDPLARDTAIGRVIGDRRTSWLPALIAAAVLVPAEESADLCALLALAAYRHGDGALALDALERALLADPDHRLSQLVMQALSGGLPPTVLDGLARDLTGPDLPGPDGDLSDPDTV